MQFSPIHFSDAIPIFPLPNCVLFPGVVQPLHIFEPRYRAMVETIVGMDGMDGSRALAMALLKPGWEKNYDGTPSIHSRVCVGRVIAHERLDDGKFNLLLQGVTRANVESEEPQRGDWGVYRTAMLKPAADVSMNNPQAQFQQRLLKQMFEKTALRDLTVTPALAALFEECDAPVEAATSPIARLIDALSFCVVQDVGTKQRLLEADDVTTRGELLMRELVALAARLPPCGDEGNWPPKMGVN